MRVTSAASSRASARTKSSATSFSTTSPRRRTSRRARRSTSSRTAPSSATTRNIRGTANWADLEGADVLIITAGIPRKPGQSRDDLVATNLPIIRDVANNAKKVCPNAFVIVISNPLDAMVYEYRRVVGAPKALVAGMAGVLDSARFQLFVAREAGVSVKDVRPMVLGGHGDDMVPVLSTTTVNGIPVSALIAKDKLDKIVERTRKGGGEIVNLMGTSAYYAPASSAVSMAKAYLRDEKRLLAAAAYLEGEYGYNDLFIGVPCVIGGKGIEKIIEIPLTDDEKAHARQERQERSGGRRHLQEGVIGLEERGRSPRARGHVRGDASLPSSSRSCSRGARSLPSSSPKS